MADNVSGTVIQRSFIGREATDVIHVASVPLQELGIDRAGTAAIVSDLLGIPESSVLTGQQYLELRRIMRPDFIFPMALPEEIQETVRSRLAPESEFELFADFLGCCTAAASPTPFQSWQLFVLNQLSGEINPRQETLTTAMQCYASRLTRSRHTSEFLAELSNYDVPLGQSPNVKSDSLYKLLETSKGFCIAPLLLTSGQAATQLSQGNYVSALLTTGTASAMTLVLIGTVSVGALIVQRVAQARGRTRR